MQFSEDMIWRVGSVSSLYVCKLYIYTHIIYIYILYIYIYYIYIYIIYIYYYMYMCSIMCTRMARSCFIFGDWQFRTKRTCKKNWSWSDEIGHGGLSIKYQHNENTTKHKSHRFRWITESLLSHTINSLSIQLTITWHNTMSCKIKVAAM